jgi:MFS transporter, ACS family, solute carrier family 17 (sodium-dependent inorganic phosphate cotransporter), other
MLLTIFLVIKRFFLAIKSERFLGSGLSLSLTIVMQLYKVPTFFEIPTRLKIAILLFMSCFVTYMLRVNISFIMIAMIQEDSSLKWTKKDQSLVLGGYFYGYLSTSLVASIFVRKFSSKDLIGLSIFFSGVITGLSVYAVQESIVPFFMTRFFLGVFAGYIYPSVQDLISRWSPPIEKGKFVFTMLGGNFGTIVTWSTFGPIIDSLDWKCAFYISAIVSMIFAVIWVCFVTDEPANHSSISKAELEYIQSSLGDSVSKTQHQLPIVEILTSLPFYALLILHFGNLFGLFFLITATPRFMTEFLKFKLTNAGCISTFPFVMRIICGFLFGSIGDYQLRCKSMKVTSIRKFYCIFCEFSNISSVSISNSFKLFQHMSFPVCC